VTPETTPHWFPPDLPPDTESGGSPAQTPSLSGKRRSAAADPAPSSNGEDGVGGGSAEREHRRVHVGLFGSSGDQVLEVPAMETERLQKVGGGDEGVSSVATICRGPEPEWSGGHERSGAKRRSLGPEQSPDAGPDLVSTPRPHRHGPHGPSPALTTRPHDKREFGWSDPARKKSWWRCGPVQVGEVKPDFWAVHGTRKGWLKLGLEGKVASRAASGRS